MKIFKGVKTSLQQNMSHPSPPRHRISTKARVRRRKASTHPSTAFIIEVRGFPARYLIPGCAGILGLDLEGKNVVVVGVPPKGNV